MNIYLATVLAGMRPENIEKLVEVGKPKYLLNTFFEGERACEKVLKIAGNQKHFLLDSGAFSFMSGAQCSEAQIEEYADRYIDFINKHHVQQYFEIDVDTIFGLPFVERIRKKCETQTGIQSIPVWHKNRGIDYWKKMVNEYDYIAIGGLVFHVKQKEWPLIHKMVDYAAARGVKVHGLGFTKTRELEKWNWYSVDSSSWKTSAIRGSIRHRFNGKYIESEPIKKQGYKMDQRLLAMYNGIEWCKYQKYMDMRGIKLYEQ